MSSKKKILAIAAALMMTMALNGCANSNTATTNSSSEQKVTESANSDQKEKDKASETPAAKEDNSSNETSSSGESEESTSPYQDYASERNDKLIDEYSKDGKVNNLTNADFSADTDIAYSDGATTEWSYSHNKKTFPVGDSYVRISSTPVTKHWWGKEKKFKVYYVFTGVKNCDVSPYDGKVTKEKPKNIDENTVVFSKVLEAKKAKNSNATTVIFKLSPKGQGSFSTDVIYDEKVDSINDASSTIDFRN